MLNVEIWHSDERVLALVLSRTNFSFLRFWICTFVILVFLSLLCLTIDLRAPTRCKFGWSRACNRISDLSCVKTSPHLSCDAFLQKLLPALCDLDMHLALFLCLSSIRRRSPCPKHSVVLRCLLFFVGGVTASLSIRWRLLGVTLAHRDDSLNVASFSHWLLLMGHCQVLMWLVVDLPCSAIPLEMMLLDINRLLLFARSLLPTNKVLMWARERWLQSGAQSDLLVPLESVRLGQRLTAMTWPIWSQWSLIAPYTHHTLPSRLLLWRLWPLHVRLWLCYYEVGALYDVIVISLG